MEVFDGGDPQPTTHDFTNQSSVTLGCAMDPLEVLPPELVVSLCLLLPPVDRARLAELSRGWRAFVRDASPLWRGVAVDMAEEADDAANLRVLLRAPRVESVALRRPAPPAVWRALRSGVQVPKLIRMLCLGGRPEMHSCPQHSSSSAQVHVCTVLSKLAADLVELDLLIQVPCLSVLARLTALRKLTLVIYRAFLPAASEELRPRPDSLRGRPRLELPPGLEELKLWTLGATNDVDVEVDLAGMRNLRQVVIGCGKAAEQLDFTLPAVMHHVGLIHARRRHLEQVRSLEILTLVEYLGEADDAPLAAPASVSALRVKRTREPALLGALRALASSVRILHLECNPEPGAEFRCEDLGSKLRACGLGALQFVRLQRRHRPHDVDLCRAQLREVRRALQGVRVDCSECKQKP